jgi:hypothetical protein
MSDSGVRTEIASNFEAVWVQVGACAEGMYLQEIESWLVSATSRKIVWTLVEEFWMGFIPLFVA